MMFGLARSRYILFFVGLNLTFDIYLEKNKMCVLSVAVQIEQFIGDDCVCALSPVEGDEESSL